MGQRLFPRVRSEAERNTPSEHTGERVVATRSEAIPAHMVVEVRGENPPPKTHTYDPETTILPGQGIMPEDGIAPGDGIPLDEGILVGSEDQIDIGADGQVTRGTPGQLDPWAENPWAEAEIGFGQDGVDPWPVDASSDQEDQGESYGDFFKQQPNQLGRGDASPEVADEE